MTVFPLPSRLDARQFPSRTKLRLDSPAKTETLPRVRRQPLSSSAAQTHLLMLIALLLSLTPVLRAAMPFNSATVTRVENEVRYGQVKNNQSETRLASPQDVVKANDFLLSEKDSRAELKYPDGSIVRIGQNTVFSFDANTRTLILEKGTFVAYVPKGSGGATIKTPSYTAAVTGTTFKCSVDRCAVVEGSITLADGRVVKQGQYFQVEADGTITIHDFDNSYDGLLMTFNGKIPTDTVIDTGEQVTVSLVRQPDIPNDSIGTATNGPDAVRQRTKVRIPTGNTGKEEKEDVTFTGNPY